MQLNVLTVPGDGIGTEVTREAVKVLEKVVSKFGHGLKLSEALLGGIAGARCPMIAGEES